MQGKLVVRWEMNDAQALAWQERQRIPDRAAKMVTSVRDFVEAEMARSALAAYATIEVSYK